MVLKISLAESLLAQPPFSSLLHWADDGALNLRLVFENYAYLWEDELYVDTYLNSIKIAAISTLLCLFIGYPIAFGIVRSNPPTKNILLLLVILPFWTSFLLRIYAWMGLLADQGTINNILITLGIVDEPIRLLYTELAVYIGIVYTYLPFMILPLYANMEKLDMTLHEAAADLGSRPAASFFTITLPLTLPGIIAGSLLVFIPATGEFVIPDLLGGGNVLMIGRVLYSEFNSNHDWPVASAVAIVLLLLLDISVLHAVFWHGVSVRSNDLAGAVFIQPFKTGARLGRFFYALVWRPFRERGSLVCGIPQLKNCRDECHFRYLAGNVRWNRPGPFRSVSRSHAFQRDDCSPTGHARSDYRTFIIVAVHYTWSTNRLAGGTGYHHDYHCTHHVFNGLRGDHYSGTTYRRQPGF